MNKAKLAVVTYLLISSLVNIVPASASTGIYYVLTYDGYTNITGSSVPPIASCGSNCLVYP